MQTIYSTLRLAAGGWALFGGNGMMDLPDTQYKVLGLIIAGIGLALVVQETAFVHAQFMKAKD